MRQLHIALFAVLGLMRLFAQDYEPFQEGPVHEAYLVKEYQTAILEPVRVQPPADINEQIPDHADTRDHWIAGYWAWSEKTGGYVWVSGTWRRPPIGHQWIPGFWKHYPEGWVWISGFWSRVNERELQFLSMPPPDLIDEKIQPPPGDNYFWVHGNWIYDPKAERYAWYSGRWERMDQGFVFVPAHYVIRDRGFVLIPAYWDFPMESRGVAYSAVTVSSPGPVDYMPSDVLDPLFILENYFPYWPNYIYLYQHHFYYNYDRWLKWGAYPPWWKWDMWWSFNWQDQWWNFWWWTHPYYPSPPWMTDELANAIDPPQSFVLPMMQKVKPPPNVTPNGVVGNFTLLRALRQATGANRPIMPPGAKMAEVQQFAMPKPPKKPFLLPKGNLQIDEPSPLKPFFGPAPDQLQNEPRRIQIPNKPVVTDFKPEKPKRRVRRTSPQGPMPTPQFTQPTLPGERQAPTTPLQPYPAPSPAMPPAQPGMPGMAPPPPGMPGGGPALPPNPNLLPIRPPHPQAYHPPRQIYRPYHVDVQPPHAIRRRPYQAPPWSEEFAPFRPEGFHIDDQEQMMQAPPFPNENIYHGSQPAITYPPVPKALQHRDYLMTYPQEQRNPPGPKVHSFPDDETHY